MPYSLFGSLFIDIMAIHTTNTLVCLGHSLELGITFYYSVPSRVVSIVSKDSYGIVIPCVV